MLVVRLLCAVFEKKLNSFVNVPFALSGILPLLLEFQVVRLLSVNCRTFVVRNFLPLS